MTYCNILELGSYEQVQGDRGPAQEEAEAGDLCSVPALSFRDCGILVLPSLRLDCLVCSMVIIIPAYPASLFQVPNEINVCSKASYK